MTTRLVLVHGSLSAASQWSRYTQLLPDLDVVAVDLPGHGTRATERFTTDAAVATIADAVASADGPVVVAGHSLGGYMAMVYAARNPGRLAGLALLGTSADPAGRLAAIYSGFAWVTQRISSGWLLRLRTRLAGWLRVERNDLPPDVTYSVLPDAWGAVFADCTPTLLTRVECPVLIVNGQFDQMRINARAFSQLAGGAPTITVPRATHLAPLTHKDEVARHLADFVSRVSPGVRPSR